MSFNVTDEQLAGFPPEARAIIRALLAEVRRLTAYAAKLETRVAELEHRLGKSPTNSSLPPST